ncbi:hypothetical protein AB3X91_19070 [Paraburkholderia sp. BR14263]|uniref:hypothetical protein n=1 Tax=unclassified Paraburkholderia TaxID=2615204 RepID=UPI0034CE383A
MSNFAGYAVKAAILGVLMYVSAIMLDFSKHAALILAIAPVVLVLLGIYTGFVYRAVGLVFIVACVNLALTDRGYDRNQVATTLNGWVGTFIESVRGSSH